jgi:hypothetical protein
MRHLHDSAQIDPLEDLTHVMRRAWIVAAMQGHSGISRGHLGELAGAGPARGTRAVDALEAGGHLVALDAHSVRAGRPFLRR